MSIWGFLGSNTQKQLLWNIASLRTPKILVSCFQGRMTRCPKISSPNVKKNTDLSTQYTSYFLCTTKHSMNQMQYCISCFMKHLMKLMIGALLTLWKYRNLSHRKILRNRFWLLSAIFFEKSTVSLNHNARKPNI